MAASGTALAALTSACCAAIAYLGTLKVEVQGPVAGEVALVEVCAVSGSSCVESEARPEEDALWIVEGVAPERKVLMVRMLDESGAVLKEEEVAPDWRRVGGSALCGGPQEAAVVVGRTG